MALVDGSRIGLYSLWLRRDGVVREVDAISFSQERKGKRWVPKETVYTRRPVQDGQPSWGPSEEREQVPLKRFAATHERVPEHSVVALLARQPVVAQLTIDQAR
jgi:hypothetical protein